ncbi:trypsin inhibitor-like [Anticarsia gemmatalis]|uniref:trypsin inhibitor-like n=1 Tax=Anticarsia gemmatalis TaxID=129554 RepID=UPI003F75E4E5
MKYISFLFFLVAAIVVSESKEERCYLPIDGGICMAHMEKYAYDVVEKRCRLFVYGGCTGNDNRFDSLEECQAVCELTD